MGTRATRLAALTGVVFIAILVPAVLLTINTPSSNSSAAKAQQYFLAHHHRYSVAALFSVLAVVFGFFFYGYLRAYFRTHPGMEWLSAIFFGGAILFASGGAFSAGIDALIGDHPKVLSASSLQLVNQLNTDLTYPATGAGLAVLYLAAGFIIYKSGALPVWLAWASWVFGIISASFILGFIGLIAMAPWALIISIMLAVRNPSIESRGPTTPAASTSTTVPTSS